MLFRSKNSAGIKTPHVRLLAPVLAQPRRHVLGSLLEGCSRPRQQRPEPRHQPHEGPLRRRRVLGHGERPQRGHRPPVRGRDQQRDHHRLRLLQQPQGRPRRDPLRRRGPREARQRRGDGLGQPREAAVRRPAADLRGRRLLRRQAPGRVERAPARLRAEGEQRGRHDRDGEKRRLRGRRRSHVPRGSAPSTSPRCRASTSWTSCPRSRP